MSTHTTSMVKMAYTCLKMTNLLLISLLKKAASQKTRLFQMDLQAWKKKVPLSGLQSFWLSNNRSILFTSAPPVLIHVFT